VTRTHVALLRGVNVLGRNKISMPALRDLVESLGHGDVVTYIQSGNVVFRAQQADADEAEIARSIGSAIAEETGVRPAVIVIGAGELRKVVRDNPFPEVADHRLLHAVFLPESPDPAGVESVAAAVDRARTKGGRDDARIVGRVLYLSTPDGFAPSALRRELDRGGANRTPAREGTARNWATVTALTALVGR
jgi:uncharacterized protein (DUF1697 family)